ncbi:MAG TPA: hypothetical protein VLV86_18220 [Vicinamibacterales bacterium]|nr:hypothetical protein [Vicinamibacterales bacterium]
MKPVISPELQRWAQHALALMLAALATLLMSQTPITWQAVLACITTAIGGALTGNAVLGPGQVDMATLPKSWRDSVPPAEGGGTVAGNE